MRNVYWLTMGGGLKFDLDRDELPEPHNPYPFLSVIFAKKGIHC